jgi:hypothetical protein
MIIFDQQITIFYQSIDSLPLHISRKIFITSSKSLFDAILDAVWNFYDQRSFFGFIDVPVKDKNKFGNVIYKHRILIYFFTHDL